MTNAARSPSLSLPAERRYNRLLLSVAGLGGLLYGVDVGIIGGALPYLEATSGLSAGQLSVIVAAVLPRQRLLHAGCRPHRRLDRPAGRCSP